jgi:hypothetical protein
MAATSVLYVADTRIFLSSTTILGYPFSAPFFIAPAASAGRAHPDAELNLVRAAGDANVLYVVGTTSPPLTLGTLADPDFFFLPSPVSLAFPRQNQSKKLLAPLAADRSCFTRNISGPIAPSLWTSFGGLRTTTSGRSSSRSTTVALPESGMHLLLFQTGLS